MKLVGQAGTWVMFALVVAAALSTFLPLQESHLPGALQLAVVDGPGPDRTRAAVTFFCSYLSEEVRRAVHPVVVDAESVRRGANGSHLVLAPAELVPEGWEVLAWAKGSGMGAAHERPYLVSRRGEDWASLKAPRIILGDRWTWAGGRGAQAYLRERGHPLPEGFGKVDAGSNVFDHTQALAVLVHGGFDLAVVRESDLRRAIRAGWLDAREFVYGPAGPAASGIVLAASNVLGGRAKGRLRAAALNLSPFGFDRKHLPAAAALGGLAILGIESFVPDRPFPALRIPSGRGSS